MKSSKIVCEIPRRFERSSHSNFRTQGSFIHINSGKSFERIFFRQIALQNLQRKNLGFSETEKAFVLLSIKRRAFSFFFWGGGGEGGGKSGTCCQMKGVVFDYLVLSVRAILKVCLILFFILLSEMQVNI